MFAQLGNHQFQGLKSPDSWKESYVKRYGKIPLINGKDVIQSTGEELAEIELSICYSIEFCDPVTEIEALKQSMRLAEILPFISGEGSIVGKFVITSIDISNETFSPIGQLNKATVELKLMEASATEDTKKQGFALGSKNPIPQPPIPANISTANSITKDIAKAKSKVSAMKDTVTKAKKGVKSYKQAVREVRQSADSVKQAYSSAKTKLEATKKIIKRASQLPTSLDDAIKYAENLAKLDNVADTALLEISVNEMSDKADKVTARTSSVVAFSGSKEGGN
jgi:phage protein U